MEDDGNENTEHNNLIKQRCTAPTAPHHHLLVNRTHIEG